MRTLLLSSLVFAAACTPRYGDRPPLAFADLSYTSTDGKPWPTATRELPELARTYGMKRAPRVAYVELNPAGDKGTIVFIHGLGSYLKFWWFQLDTFAAKGWRVVAIDLPGYGKSEKPASFPYTMEAMADAVRELLAALEVEHPVVVGHSMGGQTALSWAIRYPTEPRALVLTSPAGFETFGAREQAWMERSYTVSLIQRLPEYAIWGSVAQANFSRWRDELSWLVEDRVRLAKGSGFDQYAYAQVRSVQGLTHNDFVRQSLGQVMAPTLVVYGDSDRLIPNPFMHGGRPGDVFEKGARAIPGAKAVALEVCGHAVQLDCPAEYNAAVGAFLEQLGAPQG
jgi:pimeloyl-ACP methyl ester carboxylesterase